MLHAARREGKQGERNAVKPECSVPRCCVFQVQKIASGLSGDPVPKAIRNGAAENRNS